jgi:hypothetical protein
MVGYLISIKMLLKIIANIFFNTNNKDAGELAGAI